MHENKVIDLARQHEYGYAMAGAFYTDTDIWAADKAILSRQWHLVGHMEQVPEPGDCKVVEFVGESIILVRGKDQLVRGFYNVCSHRGTKLCIESARGLESFVCPYHAWSFELDGKLRNNSLKSLIPDFNQDALGLKPCFVRELCGILFVNLSDSPPDFDELFDSYRPLFDYYDLAGTQVAKETCEPVQANWKLVAENGVDGYHVGVVHEAFSRVRSIAMLRSLGTSDENCLPEVSESLGKEISDWQKGLMEIPNQAGTIVGDGVDSSHLRWLFRLPLKEGFVTESRDGQPVAPLLGKFKEYDGGTTIALFNPLSSVFISSDYAVIFRWTPVAIDRFDWELIWLVNRKAREGVDFDRNQVSALHYETFLEDRGIIERVQQGMSSQHYQPGPLTPQESHVERFHRWYLRLLADTVIQK